MKPCEVTVTAQLDRQALMRVAAESLCDLRTVAKAYTGQPITLASRQRIRNAAEALGLPYPPEPVNPHIA